MFIHSLYRIIGDAWVRYTFFFKNIENSAIQIKKILTFENIPALSQVPIFGVDRSHRLENLEHFQTHSLHTIELAYQISKHFHCVFIFQTKISFDFVFGFVFEHFSLFDFFYISFYITNVRNFFRYLPSFMLAKIFGPTAANSEMYSSDGFHISTVVCIDND